MSNQITRGELYFADLNPVIGSEQGGNRPVLIIQNDTGNRFSPTVIVVALSGKAFAKANIPIHYLVRRYAGLSEKSLVLVEQIRTIDKTRLKKHIGCLNGADMECINKCLMISLGLDKA